MMTATRFDLTGELLDQLQWHWDAAARPRLAGMSDAEYFWEPVDGCWSLRPRGRSTAPVQGGTGDFVVEFGYPEPQPAPVTTIAWRLAHVIVGVFAIRNHAHFGCPPADYQNFRYAPSAAEALDQLDEQYQRWCAGVRVLDAEALGRPVGPAEGHFAEKPMISLVLHIHREVIHHLAEVALLRDLYLREPASAG